MSQPDDKKPLHQRRRFTHAGVSFERLTGFHEEGRYSVVDQDGGKWTVTSEGTNRRPWRVWGHALTFTKNLMDAAEWIRRYRERRPLSPYKAEARQ